MHFQVLSISRHRCFCQQRSAAGHLAFESSACHTPHAAPPEDRDDAPASQTRLARTVFPYLTHIIFFSLFYYYFLFRISSGSVEPLLDGLPCHSWQYQPVQYQMTRRDKIMRYRLYYARREREIWLERGQVHQTQIICANLSLPIMFYWVWFGNRWMEHVISFFMLFYFSGGALND